jgi:hypothetical protein
MRAEGRPSSAEYLAEMEETKDKAEQLLRILQKLYFKTSEHLTPVPGNGTSTDGA